MGQVENTVFLSYRRLNWASAQLIYQYLTQHGYDVFMDFTGISSGAFERVILSNIAARAHFVVVLTPNSLDRCGDTDDWLRREIEAAIDAKRNIVPLLLDGFRFDDPRVAQQLIGKLALLSQYNGVRVHADYFDAGLQRLCDQFLTTPLETILHPLPRETRIAVAAEQAAANAVLAVTKLKSLQEAAQGERDAAAQVALDTVTREQEIDARRRDKEAEQEVLRAKAIDLKKAAERQQRDDVVTRAAQPGENEFRQKPAASPKDAFLNHPEIATNPKAKSHTLLPKIDDVPERKPDLLTAKKVAPSTLGSQKVLAAVALVVVLVGLFFLFRRSKSTSTTDIPSSGRQIVAPPQNPPGKWVLQKTIPMGASAVAISPDGSRLAVASVGYFSKRHPGDKNPISILSTATGEVLQTISAHGNYIDALSYSKDGSLLASGGDVLTIWHATGGGEVGTLLHQDSVESSGVTGPVESLAFSSDSKLLAFGGSDAKLVDVGTLQQVWPSPGQHSTGAHTVAFTPDGKSLACVDEGLRNVYFIDLAPGHSRSRFPVTSGYWTIAFSPQTSWYVQAGNYGIIQMRDLATKKVIREWNVGDLNVFALAIVSHRNQVISANWLDNAVQVWNAADGSASQKLQGNSSIDTLSMTPDEKMLAVGGATVQIWRED